MEKVERAVFDKFLEDYPNELRVSVVEICAPALKQWYDPTLGEWPQSLIAECDVFENHPYYESLLDGAYDNGSFMENNWKIKLND